jgi:hypothetical protein
VALFHAGCGGDPGGALPADDRADKATPVAATDRVFSVDGEIIAGLGGEAQLPKSFVRDARWFLDHDPPRDWTTGEDGGPAHQLRNSAGIVIEEVVSPSLGGQGITIFVPHAQPGEPQLQWFWLRKLADGMPELRENQLIYPSTSHAVIQRVQDALARDPTLEGRYFTDAEAFAKLIAGGGIATLGQKGWQGQEGGAYALVNGQHQVVQQMRYDSGHRLVLETFVPEGHEIMFASDPSNWVHAFEVGLVDAP